MAQKRARKPAASKSSAKKSRARKPAAKKAGARKTGAKKGSARKSGAKKAAAKKAGGRKPPTAAQRAALRKSYNDVKKAQKELDLRMKKHTQMVSSMFFAL